MNMKWMKLILSAAFALFLQGCIVSETIETRIGLGGEGRPVTVIVEYDNISSGEDKEDGVRKDFQDLLDDWFGDQLLLDQAEEGLYVKKREVFIRDGKIVGRVTGIAKDLDILDYTFFSNEDGLIMHFDEEKALEQIVETNGNIMSSEKLTLIVWPKGVTELYWKQRLYDSDEKEAFEKNRPLLVQLLKGYLATPAKTNDKS